MTDDWFLSLDEREEGDSLEIRLVNPTARTVAVSAAGFTLVSTLSVWSRLWRRTRMQIRRQPPPEPWGLMAPPWRKLRLEFYAQASDMPVFAQPDGVAAVSEPLSELEARCHRRGRTMADIEALWVESVDGKRFEQSLAPRVRSALRDLGKPIS